MDDDDGEGPADDGPYYPAITIYGSSVAAGMGASVHAATWASIVQRRLEAIHPAVSVTNVAENGAGSKRAIGLFPLVVPQTHPTAVVVSLSLANEGLLYAENWNDAKQVVDQFVTGVVKLVASIKKLGARVVVGGVYPHQEYTAEDGAWLRYTQSQLVQALDVPVLDFLSAVTVWELLAAPVEPLSFDELELLPVKMVAEVAAERVRRSSSSSSSGSSCGSFYGAAAAAAGGGAGSTGGAATAAIPSGMWPAGSYADPGHPNDTGHAMMATAFSDSILHYLLGLTDEDCNGGLDPPPYLATATLPTRV